MENKFKENILRCDFCGRSPDDPEAIPITTGPIKEDKILVICAFCAELAWNHVQEYRKLKGEKNA